MSELPATPKQVAFLTFMGVPDAHLLTRSAAADSTRSVSIGYAEPEDEVWLFHRQVEWNTERFFLYPDLYGKELKPFLEEQLPELLHSYIRTRVTGAPEKLTKVKIRTVINAMTKVDSEWWRTPDRGAIFFPELEKIFPNCCVGGPRVRVPSEGPKIEQLRFLPYNFSTLGELLRHYAEFCEPWEVSFDDGNSSGSAVSLLSSLDSEWLNTPITEGRTDSEGTSHTVAIKRLFRTQKRTFSVRWNSDRHGWADSGPGSKLVHYFVPPQWLAKQPYAHPGMLKSLCEKSTIRNDSPFYPVDPRRTFCQSCDSIYSEWSTQHPTAPSAIPEILGD